LKPRPTQPSRPLRRRRVAKQRGALIVETLVVTPLLIMLCAIGFWFFQLHRAHMKVYQEVREPVWATATFGCGQAGETAQRMPGPQGGATVSSAAALTVPADWSPVYQNVPGGPNNEVITRPMGQANGSANEAVSGHKVFWFEPGATTFNRSAQMQCNEAVHDGNPNGTKRIAAAVFDP